MKKNKIILFKIKTNTMMKKIIRSYKIKTIRYKIQMITKMIRWNRIMP